LEVKVTLHGILRDYLPRQSKGRTTLTVPDGTSIADLVNQLKIKQTVSAAANGIEVEVDYVLQDNDDLQLFRLIAGGK
jgi:sulfur carrier protein ThiS